MPMLVLNGESDPFTTSETITEFKNKMAAADADYQFVNFPGARHSFTNPDATELGKRFGLPLEYNEESDTKSWQMMQRFLAKVFSKPDV